MARARSRRSARVGSRGRARVPCSCDPSGARRLEADEHPGDRRLARPGLADDAERRIPAASENETSRTARISVRPRPEMARCAEGLGEALDGQQRIPVGAALRLVRARAGPRAPTGSRRLAGRPRTRPARHDGAAGSRRGRRRPRTRSVGGTGSPSGASTGVGGRPGITVRRSLRASSAGRAASRPTVYGWVGAAKSALRRLLLHDAARVHHDDRGRRSRTRARDRA